MIMAIVVIIIIPIAMMCVEEINEMIYHQCRW